MPTRDEWEEIRRKIDNGEMTINEAREKVGLSPLQGCDVLLIAGEENKTQKTGRWNPWKKYKMVKEICEELKEIRKELYAIHYAIVNKNDAETVARKVQAKIDEMLQENYIPRKREQ